MISSISPATDYRSKKLTDLAFDTTAEVKQLTITQTGKTLKLEKHGSDWEIVEPKKMPADSSAVSSLLTSLTDLNATDFVSSASAPATYGLSDPTLKVWYSTAAPTTAPSTQPAGHEIAFGRFATIERNQVYASADGGPVATVSTTSEDPFKKTALDLRDKKIVDIDPAHVTGFTLSINRAATTQPTTKPSEQVEYTIARRKENRTLGPALPTTQTATTGPATNRRSPATQPESKWVIESGGSEMPMMPTLMHAVRPPPAECDQVPRKDADHSTGGQLHPHRSRRPRQRSWPRGLHSQIHQPWQH